MRNPQIWSKIPAKDLKEDLERLIGKLHDKITSPAPLPISEERFERDKNWREPYHPHRR